MNGTDFYLERLQSCKKVIVFSGYNVSVGELRRKGENGIVVVVANQTEAVLISAISGEPRPDSLWPPTPALWLLNSPRYEGCIPYIE
jgi:hypothetical protein